MRNLLARIAGRAVERPTPVIVAAVLLTLIGAVAALRLEADRSPTRWSTVAPAPTPPPRASTRSSATSRSRSWSRATCASCCAPTTSGACWRWRAASPARRPGGQVISGQPAPPACAAIARLDPSAVVFGPATFLNQFAIQANKLLGQRGAGGDRAGAAGGARRPRSRRRSAGSPSPRSNRPRPLRASRCWAGSSSSSQSLALQYGQTGLPRLDDPQLRLVGDLRQPAPRLRAEGPARRRSSPAPTRR